MLILSTGVYSQSEEIEMKNSDLERLNKEGNFPWWQNNIKFNGAADYSVERDDVNQGSTKALKVDVKTLADKGWGVSSSYNYNYSAIQGDEVTIEFYAKGSGSMKLVTSNEVQGSFQGKNFFLNEDWTKYTHTFSIQNNSGKHKIKFWYLDLGVYIIDDIRVFKETF
tara:strand:+ start:584 stop:1084 length:501 start_codon:yes stop_codon:yes gene_type:complete